MKLFIITETGIEYDDNYHHTPECGGGTPVVAFRKRENAQAECDRRTLEKMRSAEYCFERGNSPELFTVSEIECEDADVVSYSERLAVKKQAAEQAAAAAKAHLSEKLRELFDSNPDLLAIRWSQYTPHFNDGDTCEFGVNECYVKFAGAEDFKDQYDLEGERKVIPSAADKVIQAMDGDDLEKTFGDHVQVTATRDGFEVDEYEHD